MSIRETQEALCVVRAQQGDRDAFANLVDTYDRRLLYFIRRLIGETDEASDVVQSVWLQVHRSLRKLKSPRAFRVWLYRIAHAQAMTLLRQRMSAEELFETLEDLDVPTDSQEFAISENAELIHLALQDLSVVHRRVLVLRFLEDMTIEEIAQVLECRSGTVKSRLYYARVSLRQRIKEMNHD